MKILALDLGTKTGWAFGYTEDETRLYSGMQNFELKRGESPGMKYLYFDRWIQQIFADYDPKAVAYEMPHHRGGYASQLLLGFLGILIKVCEARECNYVSVHSSTLKKHATGRGRGVSKQEMIDAAEMKFKRRVQDDNEADALHIWDYAKTQLEVRNEDDK